LPGEAVSGFKYGDFPDRGWYRVRMGLRLGLVVVERHVDIGVEEIVARIVGIDHHFHIQVDGIVVET
jgi:hypothetical protein